MSDENDISGENHVSDESQTNSRETPRTGTHEREDSSGESEFKDSTEDFSSPQLRQDSAGNFEPSDESSDTKRNSRASEDLGEPVGKGQHDQNDQRDQNEGKGENGENDQHDQEELDVVNGQNDQADKTDKSTAAHSPQALQTPRTLPPRTYISTAVDTDPRTVFPETARESLEASSLLEARQSELSLKFDAKDELQRRAINTGVASLRKTYRDIRSTLGHLPSESLDDQVDWPLWDKVVHDYHDMVVHEQQQLSEAVAAGIPAAVRGIVWQLVARSKNLQLEELYMHLKTEPCIHDKAIKRDLTRTSFFTNVDAANKAGELASVIRAYSNFDPDVGYTQGMVFIAVPLIMNMTESECFCLLVTLMKDYALRELFCPQMRGLHLLLHQFDRLVELHRPLLYNHLVRQGVRSSMYASQWFLTFFSYKFPLAAVLRIFDMVLTQGVEALLRLALNLLLQNETRLMALDFDALLHFLKDSLFDIYVSDEYVSSEPAASSHRFSLLSLKMAKPPKPASYYRLDEFIADAMAVAVSALDLARWRAEFDSMLRRDGEKTHQIDALRSQNGTLRHEIKELEMQTYALNHDHLAAVQKLVAVKVALPEVVGDVAELRGTVATLEHDVRDLEVKVGANTETIPQDIEARIHELLAQNASEAEKLSSLEEQLQALAARDEELAAELRRNKKWFWA